MLYTKKRKTSSKLDFRSKLLRCLFLSIFLLFHERPCSLTLSRVSAKCWMTAEKERKNKFERQNEKRRGEGKRKEEVKETVRIKRKREKDCVFRWMGKLTRGLAPQYQDLTRCVSPPSRWDLQPPKPPPPPPLSEPLSSLLSSSSSSSKSRFLSPAPRLPLPIISASLPSQPPSLSCVATSAYNTTGNASC